MRVRVSTASPLGDVVARTARAIQDDDHSRIRVRNISWGRRAIAEAYLCRLIDENHIAFAVPCERVIDNISAGVDATGSLLLEQTDHAGRARATVDPLA